MVDLETQFSELKGKYSEACSNLKYIENKLEKLSEEAESLRKRQINIGLARAIIQEVALKTQQNLEYHVSSLVTTALKHVDPTWPDYLVEFVTRRNRTECDLMFFENNRKQHPLAGAGGGAVDVGSFAQLVSYGTLRKISPFLVLDEPFRNVSPDLQGRVSEMLELVCSQLGLQILMVSHAEDINMAATKTFKVTKENGISKVEEKE